MIAKPEKQDCNLWAQFDDAQLETIAPRITERFALGVFMEEIHCRKHIPEYAETRNAVK